ncbi:MAG: pyridoxamine 5'-phosphate oxidase [Flavobacteriales bacterium]
MSKELDKVRKDYGKNQLELEDMPENPIELFELWLNNAKESDSLDYNAMTLATVGSDGYPQTRIVLLRSIIGDRLVFYTNYRSDKGQELENQPKVSLNFFWKELERQVRIVGDIEKVKPEVSDAYFISRPRQSQIGAWASEQSSVVESGDVQKRLKHFEQKFEGQDVPRPAHWGGYKIIPRTVEFWQGRPSRLHDRVKYIAKGKEWEMKLLSP